VIPYYKFPEASLGPVPLDPWGILVTLGFMVGLEVARARGIKLGLDVRDIVDGVVATVGMGFVVGHLVHVLAYHPEKIEQEGIVTLAKLWAGFSSFGGFLGAVIGCTLFFRVLRPRPFWPHADVVMYAFPFGWIFGRLGCFAAHDHIGKLTDFPLAVAFPQGTRHDLGLYEALWTMVIASTFYALGRRKRPPALFAMTWCFMYAPVRFGLDFLRNTDLPSADVRWHGLTPAQWGCIVMLGAGAALWRTQVRARPGG
jgi:phosphatidylglycerol:prolipoprotein diacylglycerol transferase